jgi:hypothetical protein
MAKGDLHVEQWAGAWTIAEEGDSRRSRQQLERLGSPDQAWRIALYYGESSGVDVFLHMKGRVTKEALFRSATRR